MCKSIYFSKDIPIFRLRAGKSSKNAVALNCLRDGKGPPFKLKKSAIDYRKPAAWEPRHNGRDEEALKEEEDRRYTTRKLQCPHCPGWTETSGLKLRTNKGYRNIACRQCNVSHTSD